MKKEVLIALLFPMMLFAQDYWNLEKDENDIKIYTRNSKNSALKEYKAITVINTPSKYILKELLEAPAYHENCEPGVSYYVKALNDKQHVFYAHKDLPWPIKDRDIITLLTLDKLNPTITKLTLESLPYALPSKAKTIRVKTVMGHWLLEEMGDKTKVTQQLFLDPEGNLPAFIVNNLLIKGPFQTFKDLQKAVSTVK